MNLPAFAGGVMVELRVGCTYDFDVLATKYLVALSDGEIPLVLLFSGSIFYSTAAGMLRMARIPWSKGLSNKARLAGLGRCDRPPAGQRSRGTAEVTDPIEAIARAVLYEGYLLFRAAA